MSESGSDKNSFISLGIDLNNKSIGTENKFEEMEVRKVPENENTPLYENPNKESEVLITCEKKEVKIV